MCAIAAKGQCVIVDCSVSTYFKSISLNSQITDILVKSTVWSQIAGTGATIADPAAASTTVNNLNVGTNIFKFTVTSTNNVIYTANDTVIVLAPVAPSVYIIASSLTTVKSYDTLTAITSDPSGAIVKFGWGQISSNSPKSTINGAATTQAVITGLYPGIWSFKVTVTSSTGLTASATITITVNNSAHILKVVIYYDDGTVITYQ